jgi:hypothetical protein
MRACAHKEGSLAHPWAAVVTSVTLMRSRSSYTHTYTDTRVYMFVCLFFWVYLTAGCLTLIRSRSSCNHTYQQWYLCVCMYMFVLFSVCFSEYTLRLVQRLTISLFLLDTGLLISTTTSCRPCHRIFFPDFHRFSECSCFSWLSTEILCLSECVDFLSLLDMYLPLFWVLFVFVCFCVTVCTGRQTDTEERWVK